MRDLDHAERLIDAAVGATSRPVTLKMRLGWCDATKNAPELAARAEKAGIKAITVHGRTRQQFYKGTADWAAVKDVKAATALPIIVNGDITDEKTAREALMQSGADAVMIGRGTYGRPWIASAIDKALAANDDLAEPSLAERLAIVLDHLAELASVLRRRTGSQDFPQASRLVHRAGPLSYVRRRSARGEKRVMPDGLRF